MGRSNTPPMRKFQPQTLSFGATLAQSLSRNVFQDRSGRSGEPSKDDAGRAGMLSKVREYAERQSRISAFNTRKKQKISNAQDQNSEGFAQCLVIDLYGWNEPE
jgi:hypothetical protein